MAMLNFKYGIFGKLPKSISDGTIYVTTDEKAMYVDLDGSRIRLSQIVTLSTSEWQKLTPPYSTEAFYYLSDSNALLKYSGTAWVQLNSKKDLQDALAGLGFLGVLSSTPATNVSKKGQICTVGNNNYIYNGSAWVAFGLVGDQILNLQTTVASHTETLADHTKNIKNLQDKDTAIEEDITLLKKGVGYVGSGTSLPTNPTEGDIFIHNGTIKVYCKNPATATSATWNAVGNASKRLEDLRARVEIVAAAAGDRTIVEKLVQDLADLSDTVSAITKDATTLTTLKKVEEKFAGLKVQDLTDAETLATDSELAAAKSAVLGQKDGKDFAGTVMDAYANASAAQTTATSAQNDANTANNAIAAIKKGATITTFKGIQDVIANLGNTYATDKELSDGLDSIQGATTKTIKDVEGITDGHANRLADLEKDVDDIQKDIVSKMQAADAMEYKGTITVNTSGSPVFPTSKVSIGHTYKAIAEFTYNGTAVYVGDLLIAKAKDSTVKEDADGYLPSNGIAWDHIPSGYVADYNPRMKLVAANNSVDINLTSAHANTETAGDLGDFQISAATGSSITVTVQSETNNIAIGMSWGTFN